MHWAFILPILDEIKAGTSPYGDNEITYTCLRPSEKLYEELLIGENVLSTCHEKLMRAEEDVILWNELKSMINKLIIATDRSDSN